MAEGLGQESGKTVSTNERRAKAVSPPAPKLDTHLTMCVVAEDDSGV